jgi:5,5'-dehydrodivanillate O-demethylase
LCEDLVLFKDKAGRVGLIADHCAHRGASLLYGRVEERGIACAYHGWLYDTSGNCLETPAEPADSKFYLTVKMKAYPVQKLCGLFWAYLGPTPAPALPHYDILVRRDGHHSVQLRGQLDCNYFQAMENSVDPAHLQILHQTLIGRGRTPPNTTRGFIDDVVQVEFYEVPYGIMKRRTYQNNVIDEHPLVFPNVLRQYDGTEIRVPIDDTHTWIYGVHVAPSENGDADGDEDPPVEYAKPYKDPPDGLHPLARFRMDQVPIQDHMSWETQGPIADRTAERLATSDRGIVMLREMMRREIEKVQKGLDPLGLVRDPDHAMIDTNLKESLALARKRGGGKKLVGA